MGVPAFNKVTKQWTSTDSGVDLTPASDWIIDPIFNPDKETCMRHGPEFWSYSGNVISTVSETDYQAAVLNKIKQQKWREIQTERDRRMLGGVKVGNYWFHTDDTSRVQQLGLLMMGSSMPTGIMWKTMTGEFVEMTPALIQQIFNAVANHDITTFGVAEQHRANMNASSDPENYDFSTGWPLIYGE